MRRRVTHNHYFEQVDALLSALDQFHQELKSNTEQVRRLSTKWARPISAWLVCSRARLCGGFVPHEPY
jgi:hypothetical protein